MSFASVARFEIHLTGAGGGPLPTGFEEAAARLASIDRLTLEPDGHFAWLIDAKSARQISGLLYDDGRQLQFVHIWGHCCRQDFQRLLLQIYANDAVFCVTPLPMGGLQDLQTFQAQTWPDIDQAKKSSGPLPPGSDDQR